MTYVGIHWSKTGDYKQAKCYVSGATESEDRIRKEDKLQFLKGFGWFAVDIRCVEM